MILLTDATSKNTSPGVLSSAALVQRAAVWSAAAPSRGRRQRRRWVLVTPAPVAGAPAGLSR